MTHPLHTLREELRRADKAQGLRALMAAYALKLSDPDFPDGPAIAGVARCTAALARMYGAERRAAA